MWDVKKQLPVEFYFAARTLFEIYFFTLNGVCVHFCQTENLSDC